MKKRIILSVVLPLVLLTSCGAQATEPSPTEISFSETTSENPVPAADGFETLGGSWEVGAVYYNNRIVDIKDVSTVFPLSHKSSVTSPPSLNTGKFRPIRFSGYSDSSFL